MLCARRSAAFILAGVLLSACSTDRPTSAIAPTAPTAPTASAAVAAKATAELRERERSERERVRRARQESMAAFVSLQQQWAAGHGRPKQGSPVLACAPQHYDADVQIVGPQGGVLRAGEHTLTIPRGALAVPTVITMESPVGAMAQVEFSPHGLQFARSAAAPTLTLGYGRCTPPADPALADAPLAVAYVTGDLDVLEWPTSSAASPSELVAEIWHFSRYVAARRSTYAVSW